MNNYEFHFFKRENFTVEFRRIIAENFTVEFRRIMNKNYCMNRIIKMSNILKWFPTE